MRRPAAAVAAVGALLALLALATPATGGRFSASIANSTDTAATDPYFQCSAILGSGVDGANALFVWPLTESSGTSAADTSGHGNAGTYVVAPTSDTATSPVKACPRDSGSPWLLDGSTTYAYFGTQQSNPTTFSEEVWFKTTVASGKLMGFGGSKTGASSTYDRHLYINTTGQLVFGIYNSGAYTVASPATVTDGKWHQAVATLAPTGTYGGMRLYLDGVLVATDTAHATPENTSGYWRLGYDTQSGWPGVGSNNYFKGSLRYASVYSVVLTPTQVAQHYGAGAGS